MNSQPETEARDAVLVVLDGPGAAGAALRSLHAAELTHVLSRSADEPDRAFARRVLQRARILRTKGLRIRDLKVAVASGPDGSRSRGRLLASLVRALHPGATVTLVTATVSQVDMMSWVQALMPIARAGVSLDIVA